MKMDPISQFIENNYDKSLSDIFLSSSSVNIYYTTYTLKVVKYEDEVIHIFINNILIIVLTTQMIHYLCDLKIFINKNNEQKYQIMMLSKFLSFLICKEYQLKIRITNDIDYFNFNSYPEFTVDDLIRMRTQNLTIFDQLPIMPIKIKHSVMRKDFNIILPEYSRSKIKKLLLFVTENDYSIGISCNEVVNIICGNEYIGGQIRKKEIDRLGYSERCHEYRIKYDISPFQNGKEMAKTLYFLAWLIRLDFIFRTDLSNIGECKAPNILIRLASNKEPLLVEDGFKILQEYIYNVYIKIKNLLQSDETLVNLSLEYFKNIDNEKKQSELCKMIDVIINEKYLDESEYLKNIVFTKKIDDKDALLWINKWTNSY